MNRMRMKISALTLGVAVMTSMLGDEVMAQTVIFVNKAATGTDDGSSWANAYQYLQDALGAANPGDQIWVAEGNYRPDEGSGRVVGDRSESFGLVSGVRIFGGFSGNETRYVDRKPEIFRVFLTGDLSGDDAPDFAFREDNSFHVATGSGVDNTTLLDGFYITGGNADGADADSVGGGMFVIGGSPSVMNTVFLSNSARCGGGLYSEGQTPEIVNSVFNGNNAFSGGAICNVDSNPSIVNSTIVDNFADRGAGIYNRDSSPVIVNSILARNVSRSNMLECQRAGYPCTFAQMDPAVITKSTALSDEVRDHMESESAETALAWVREQPDVVFAEGDEAAILFRLQGGPQTWVLGEAALGGQPSSGKHGPQFDFGGIRKRPTSALSFIDVVGDDTNNDGKRNNRDKKKALLLSPFQFDFDPSDEGSELKTMFESVEAYASDVSFYSNAGAGVEKFEIWDDYDVVHVSTHGARICDDSTCRNTIATGTRVSETAPPQSIEPGLSINNIGPNLWYLGLGSDFMNRNYPQGLDRTILFLNACETGDGDTQPNRAEVPDLASVVLGLSSNFLQRPNANSVYLGWSETVDIDVSFNTSLSFYKKMLDRGWRTRIARKEVLAEGLGVGVNPTTRLRTWAQRGYDLHLREMVTLIGDDGMKLEDGGNITWYFDGILNDGLPDSLWIDVLVEGIDDGTESEYELSFELDGQSLGAPVPLSSADFFEKTDDYTYSVSDIVPSGKDMKPNDTYTLEAIIDMPGGGQSRYEASDLELDGCFWNLSMGGTRAGSYKGEAATYVDQGGGFQLILQSVNPNPITQIFLYSSPPKGTSGPYEISLNNNGDGSALINLFALFVTPPFQYGTGDGSDLKDLDGNVLFTLPDASKLTVRRKDETISGFAFGSIWGTTNNDPVNPTYETAGWSLEFSAENGLNPDSTPRIDACAGN
ncbi:MAG: hypothetical protein BMS9Abin05_1743 [Rhodothermia bacterium]|nr:MAG: hypothetical protein BMS9Abin05_1743 [Rhodothermia bacterium]